MTWIFVEVVAEGQEVRVIWINQEPYDLYESGDDRPFCFLHHATSALLEEHPVEWPEGMMRMMTSVMNSDHPGKEVIVVSRLSVTKRNQSHHWLLMKIHHLKSWR